MYPLKATFARAQRKVPAEKAPWTGEPRRERRVLPRAVLPVAVLQNASLLSHKSTPQKKSTPHAPRSDVPPCATAIPSCINTIRPPFVTAYIDRKYGVDEGKPMHKCAQQIDCHSISIQKAFTQQSSPSPTGPPRFARARAAGQTQRRKCRPASAAFRPDTCQSSITWQRGSNQSVCKTVNASA